MTIWMFKCYQVDILVVIAIVILQEYDATLLVSKFKDVSATILIDQVST